LMLVALILRGVGFEFRSKEDNRLWRAFWDGAIFFGSFVPALLWGVAIANVVRGVPIDGSMNYTGNFFTLLSPYTILGGLVFLAIFTLHGALFLSLKTGGEIQERAHQAAQRVWLPTLVLTLAFVVYSYFETDLFKQLGFNPGLTALSAGTALFFAGMVLRKRQHGIAFLLTSLTILFTVVTVFRGLFPRVMVSSTDPAFSLTVYNASSSDYTLTIMTVIALMLVPIVLIYQGWTYWVFRKRLTLDSHMEY